MIYSRMSLSLYKINKRNHFVTLFCFTLHLTMSISFDFSGKKALVTGAGRGIGREIVKQLIAAKASVVALDKVTSSLESLKKEYPNLRIICVDLANWEATSKALDGIDDIDFLINNAAHAECLPIGKIDEGTFDRQFDVNVKAIINVTQKLAEGMKRRRYGSIVNMSSIAGVYGLPDHLIYAGTKAALDGMTRVMACELGPHMIRVNSLNPTVTWTDMAWIGWPDKEKQRGMMSKIPMNRFAEVGEVAQTTLFLLSDASSLINGVTLLMDGGAGNTCL